MGDTTHPTPAAGRALDAAALHRTVGLLALASFASSVAMRMCDPLLPKLAQDFQVPVAQAAGAITGFAVAYGLLQLVIGPLGDRLGKYRVATWATALGALAGLACAAAPSLPALVAARVLAGAVGGAIIPLALAWIGDEVPYERRQTVLARVLSGGLLGLVTGQLLSGVLADTLGWRWAFVGLSALMLGVAWRMAQGPAARRPAPVALPTAPGWSWRGLGQAYADILRPRWSQGVLAAVLAEGLLMYGAMSFVPTALHERFGVPLWQAALASATIGLGGYAYTQMARRLVGWWGEAGLALAGGTGVALGLATLAGAGGLGWALAGCAVLGLGFYAFHNTLQVHGTQLSQRHRSTGMAVFVLVFFLGQSLGVALAAQAVARLGYGWMFGGAALAFAGLGLATRQALRHRQRVRG